MEEENNDEIVLASLVAHSYFPEDSPEILDPAPGIFFKPMQIDPKTLLGFLCLLISFPDFITKQVCKAIDVFRETEEFQDFIKGIKDRLIDSLQAGLTEISPRESAHVLFNNHIPTLQDFYNKIIGQLLLHADLLHSVNDCLRNGNLGNGLIAYLIFLCQSFFESEMALNVVQAQSLSWLKVYREITAKDDDEVHLIEGYHWMCEKFTIWKTGEPNEGQRYIALEISLENIMKSDILGVFVDGVHVVVAPYGKYVVEEKIIDEHNVTQRIKFRVCPQKGMEKYLKEDQAHVSSLEEREDLLDIPFNEVKFSQISFD